MGGRGPAWQNDSLPEGRGSGKGDHGGTGQARADFQSGSARRSHVEDVAETAARELAQLDLGQTIVVRGKACVAIEAMEGTDATIRRAGELMRGKEVRKKIKLTSGPLTVLKLSKPDQDMRFDVPVVGVPTIQAMVEAGATCLCLSAGKTLMFDRHEMIGLADENRIAIVAA